MEITMSLEERADEEKRTGKPVPSIRVYSADTVPVMEQRAKYARLRAIDATLPQGEFFTVVSLATADGGIAGVVSEVSRHVAVRMIGEGRVQIGPVEGSATIVPKPCRFDSE